MNSTAAAYQYDFIIVGAGTADCVLAARVSEQTEARVLLLEAGGREPLDAVAVPPAWPSLAGTSADWGDTAVPLGASGTTMRWARGRGLGGSSSINGMIFTRGHRSSYDAWPLAGAAGWGFDELLPHLKRSEHADGRDPALRGVAGPLPVSPATRRRDSQVSVGQDRAADVDRAGAR